MQINVINDHKSITINEQDVTNLAKSVIKDETLSANDISIIFVHDDYLRKLHKDYLKDDSPTDVMSFNLGENDQIEGEIYISLDRARIHAAEFNVSLDSEIARLIIHGLLHLKGFDDQTDAQQNQMRQKEDQYLKEYSESLYLL
jgi:probable rRNA maturation factor